MKKPLTTIEEAKSFVSANFKERLETLEISDSLNDPMGIKMAIILDAILNAGYMPDGFEQEKGYRTYRYKRNES